MSGTKTPMMMLMIIIIIIIIIIIVVVVVVVVIMICYRKNSFSDKWRIRSCGRCGIRC